jgi:hypothetical protein
MWREDPEHYRCLIFTGKTCLIKLTIGNAAVLIATLRRDGKITCKQSTETNGQGKDGSVKLAM